MSQAVNEKVKPLEGKALLDKIKTLNKASRREKARLCGYYSLTGKKKEIRVNLSGFYNAILKAKGASIDPDSAKDGRGREPTYRVSVHQNGQIVIGSTYTQTMGLKPGDEFEIKLGYKHIRLQQLDKSEKEE